VGVLGVDALEAARAQQLHELHQLGVALLAKGRGDKGSFSARLEYRDDALRDTVVVHYTIVPNWINVLRE
jgi:hypothetical protein